MYVDLDQVLVFSLVLLRMTGMFVTNPILGRPGIPTMTKAGLAFILSILLTTSMQLSPPADPNFAQFIIMCVKELAIGMIASFILQMFLSILIIGGEIVDMQLGIGMAKIFDPGTNTSISLTSTLFNSLFILIFFLTDNHLTLIKLASQTFEIIPLGSFKLDFNSFLYLPEFMSTIILYAVKLSLPIVVIEIIVTMAVGIIMRIIPQINIFVVNIQLKLMIGFFAMWILIGPFMGFFDNMIAIFFEQVKHMFSILTL